MKRLLSVLCVIAIAALMLSLASCGETGSTGGSASEESLDGEYIMIEWVTGETDYTPVLENVDIILTVNKNKATVELMGDTVDWQVDTKEKVMRSEDGSEVPYRLENDQLIVEGEEKGVHGKMVFERKKDE